MKYVLIAVVVLALVYVLLRRPTPIRYRRLSAERLLKMVQVLYFRGFDGGELLLRQDAVDHPTFRVVKQIIADNDVALHGDVVVRADSSEYEKIKRELDAHFPGYQAHDPRSAELTRTFHMAFGNDLAGVCRVARVIFENALGVSIERDCHVYFLNVSERNVRIGWTS